MHQSVFVRIHPTVERTKVRLNHGLRTPNETFFHFDPELFGLDRQIGQINSAEFGVFSAKLSAPILVVSPLSMFFLIQQLFLQKNQNLYIHIQNIHLGLGFEFGPQRIRDLAIVCP